MGSEKIVKVAIPVPLRRDFDFLLPENSSIPSTGVRVLVPFGSRKLVGVVTQVSNHSTITPSRLKKVIQVLDEEPVVSEPIINLIHWCAQYYQQALGLTWQTALPKMLRKNNSIVPSTPKSYVLTEKGFEQNQPLSRAPVQQRIMQAILASPNHQLDEAALDQIQKNWKRAIHALLAKGWVKTADYIEATQISDKPKLDLNQQQQQALRHITDAQEFSCFLLFGITGSGKTEVYLEAIQHVVAQGKQAMVLVPEISLTPQLILRFEQYFSESIAILHSGLSDKQRHFHWWRMREGHASVLLGTRSAIFAALKQPGIIIIDEEHDTSYKQQDGLRYHARDVGVYRAKLENIPIILGSATPSLESLHNVNLRRYQRLELSQRAIQNSHLPTIRYIDLHKFPSQDGISLPLFEALQQRLEKGEQSLLFINRRGYAPIWCCYDCGWQAQCQRCDAYLTFHRQGNELLCHHCGRKQYPQQICPNCESNRLGHLGAGTQRIEESLNQRLPQVRIVRIDRDSSQRKGALEHHLDKARNKQADILVGTQLLTKGHDFPYVTLVGVINADQGLYSVDFRATEHLFQQLIQVAGRAGRGSRSGEVLIQTLFPDHPVFQPLKNHEYEGFSTYELAERQQADYPPYSYFALLRAESTRQHMAMTFLSNARKQLLVQLENTKQVMVMDVVPSPMEKRAGRYRAQLLLIAKQRSVLNQYLKPWLDWMENNPQARRVRWSLDIDPVDMY